MRAHERRVGRVARASRENRRDAIDRRDDAGDCPSIANPGQEDGDDAGAGDARDNCLTIPDEARVDAGRDGYGNACDPDLNNDGIVHFGDPALMKSVFFETDPFADRAMLKRAFFKSRGPAAGKP